MSMPSVTSQAVALTRAGLDRPHSPEGDPGAQLRLCRDMSYSPPAWLRPSIAARTRFVDEQVMAAIAAGLQQIVICGAGYDDRALRFRTSGVRFFELDQPATQRDKARLLGVSGRVAGDSAAELARADASGLPGLTLAAADFATDDAGAVLALAGHVSSRPTLFICEGLLVYLDPPGCETLLASLAARSAPGSLLVASIATHADGYDSAEVTAVANGRRRTGAAEPWRTILPAADIWPW